MTTPIWLVEAAIRGAALLTITTLVAWLLRRDRATVRHRVWALGFIAVLALPVLHAMLPWRWNAFPVAAVVAAPGIAETTTASLDPLAATDAPLVRTDVASQRAPQNDAAQAAALVNLGTHTGPQASAPIAFGTILFAVWLVGVLAITGRLAYGLLAMHRLVRRAMLIDDPEWHDQLDACRRSIRLPPYPRLLFSDDVSVPIRRR